MRIPLLETTHRDRLNAFRAAHPDSGEPELVLIPLLGPNQGDRIKPLEEHTLIHRVRIKPLEQHTLIREPELVLISLLGPNHRDRIKCHLNSSH